MEKINAEPTLDLPVLPMQSDMKFSTPDYVLLPQQHELLDNLWSNRHNSTKFLEDLKTLSLYFKKENEKALPSSSTMNIPDEKQQARSLKKEAEKTEEISKRLVELEEENKEMKDLIERERKERKEKLEEFPEEISCVKEQILKKVLYSKNEEFIIIQKLLREMACTVRTPKGLAFSCKKFLETVHENNFCRCNEGFSVVRCSLDLRTWRDQKIRGIELSLNKLMSLGFICRIIITAENQTRFFRNWRISHLIHQIFRKNYCRDGFINMKIESIPPAFYTGYPDEARHIMCVRFLESLIPVQVKISPETFRENIIEGDILQQMKLWRSFELAQKLVAPPEGRTLIFEDKNIKFYYLNEWISAPKLTVPFSGLIHHRPGESFHLKNINARPRCNFGDTGEDSYSTNVYSPPNEPFEEEEEGWGNN